MTANRKPKPFDVVEFNCPRTETISVPRVGTIVELLGPETALVEISDETGITRELATMPLRDLKIVWESGKTA